MSVIDYIEELLAAAWEATPRHLRRGDTEIHEVFVVRDGERMWIDPRELTCVELASMVDLSRLSEECRQETHDLGQWLLAELDRDVELQSGAQCQL